MMMQSMTSVIFSENPRLVPELVTAAIEKLGAVDVRAVVLASSQETRASKIASVKGVSKIYELKHDASNLVSQEQVAVKGLEIVCNEARPSFVLVAATRRGREVAPRLATRLGYGCITDALNPRLEEGRIVAERVVWGGNAIAKISTKDAVVMTIPPKAHEPATGEANPELRPLEVNPGAEVRVVGRSQKPTGKVNIKDADVVISAGRGFKKKEDLSLLDELAQLLNGVIGASRPLTSDLGWMPEERQVGLSGVTVKPKLYIAVGISGQIQHLTGMRDSKLVVAINTDKNAPIFQECDYGVVGDLYCVIPALIRALRSKKV